MLQLSICLLLSPSQVEPLLLPGAMALLHQVRGALWLAALWLAA